MLMRNRQNEKMVALLVLSALVTARPVIAQNVVSANSTTIESRKPMPDILPVLLALAPVLPKTDTVQACQSHFQEAGVAAGCCEAIKIARHASRPFSPRKRHVSNRRAEFSENKKGPVRSVRAPDRALREVGKVFAD
jgi:hypothetical protein